MAAGPGFAVMDRLMRQHPRIVFNVVTGGELTLHRNLAEREVEVVMSAVSGPVSEEFRVDTLFSDRLVVVAGLQSPWTRRRKIALADLVNEPWTLLQPGGPAGAL